MRAQAFYRALLLCYPRRSGMSTAIRCVSCSPNNWAKPERPAARSNKSICGRKPLWMH